MFEMGFITFARIRVTRNVQQHTINKFSATYNKNATQTYNTLTNVYGDETMHHVFQCHKSFLHC
jgi:hypothetical protein